MATRKPKAEVVVEAPEDVTVTADVPSDTVTLPAPPDGYRYVLLRGDYCPAQVCPARLDDPQAYAKT